MTYLELVRRAAKESGTVPDSALPSTLAGATGRIGAIAGWVQQAWQDIQTHRMGWLWMQSEWQAQLVPAQQAYTVAELGIVDLAQWLHFDVRDTPLTTLYDAGPEDEGRLHHIDWRSFYARFQRGVPDAGRPTWYTVTPQRGLAFAAVPDAAYTVRGLYRRLPQVLVGDDDTPEMPVEYMDVIWRGALVSLAMNDEAAGQYPVWDMRYRARMGDLERDHLPALTIGAGALA